MSLEIIFEDQFSPDCLESDDVYYCEPSSDVTQFSPLSQLNESSFEAISQDERIVDLLQYLYTNDEISTDKTDASSANVH